MARTRLAALFAAVLVCAPAAGLAAPKAVTPEIQKDAWAQSWWMPRHQQKVEEAKQRQGKVDLLMIGDSITQSWEGAGKKVWEEFYGRRNAFNIGFSGDRTEQVIWRLQNGEVEGIAPKLVVLMIGTNNTGHRADKAEETAAGVRMILDELKARMPKAKVLLLAIFPRGEKPTDKGRVLNDAINTRIAAFADNQRVFFLDVGPKFLKEDGTLPKDLMPDFLHPNETGYRIWAEAMEPAIAKLMGE